MSQSADISTKKIISLAPDNWVRWVTQIPNLVAQEVLNSEFQWISREGDVLIRAHSPELGEFLVLNELQLRYTTKMPKRMRAYAALAEEKYNLPTYPVLINILKEGDTKITTRYKSQFAGLKARQDYRVINLWEVDVDIVFQQPIASLLPFVPILKGGNEQSVVQQALQLLRQDEQLSQLETVLAFFASFVLDSALVQQIMRWDMAVLRESPWYQQILQEGEARGEARGKTIGEAIGEARGEARGRREERLLSIEMLLEMKFGTQGLQLMSEISEMENLEQLRSIQQAIRTANTVDELRQLFSEQ
jgi:predicted transposase YdaD